MKAISVKRAVRMVVKPLAGNSDKECGATCDLVIFAAKGLKARRWETAKQFEAAVKADKRFKAIDPATIAMIVEMVMAMLEAKE